MIFCKDCRYREGEYRDGCNHPIAWQRIDPVTEIYYINLCGVERSTTGNLSPVWGEMNAEHCGPVGVNFVPKYIKVGTMFSRFFKKKQAVKPDNSLQFNRGRVRAV